MTLTTTTTASSAESQAKMDVKGGALPGEENLPTSEMDLLAKLEAANKLIESDAKSLNSLHSTHSRKNSDTSQISLTSSKYELVDLQVKLPRLKYSHFDSVYRI